MKIGTTLYVSNRKDWRNWLSKNHSTAKEIWLVYYKKDSGKPRIPYNDSVEEALCYGWIDSTAKKIDEERFAQRFTPRRAGSPLSQMNRERVRRLIRAKKMTKAGLKAIEGQLNKRFTIASDILSSLKKNDDAWKNFQKFPKSYQRIRIAFIEGARKRPEMFQRRLNYFLKMAAQNKRFGMVQ
ncbi:MAG: YdeI/OmpD-associated family protein [Ignavibacteriales bacterium]|nr:YdeI/OmpD-associated family protein [Ignavibacteriales bacterium]